MRYACRCYDAKSLAIVGTTLIEVLITLLVMGVGILIVVAAATNSLKATRYAFYTAIALQQAKSLAEYQLNTHTVTSILSDWNQHNQQLLPQGQGHLQSDAGAHVIIVSWFDNHKLYGVRLWIKK